MKDDSGSYAVFTEEESSASQMTAAKVLDVISRLPGCAGQASDAVSAHAHFKMEDAHKLLKCFGIGVSRHLDSITTLSMAKKLAENSRATCFSREECVWSLTSRIAPGKTVRKGLDRERKGESPGVGVYIKDSCYLYTWTTSRWLGRETIYNPYGKDG